jgi:hypothetical protein
VNVGSRVHTPDGPGTLRRFVIDERWAFGRPDVIRWAGVQLDGKDFVQMFHPGHIKEAPVNEPEQQSGVLIQEPENTTTEEPEPTPEPEPDDEEADEKLEELIEFPE